VPASLLDSNVWLAAAFAAHPADGPAREALLASFAIAGEYRLLTLDSDFRQHVSAGLSMRVLGGDATSGGA